MTHISSHLVGGDKKKDRQAKRAAKKASGKVDFSAGAKANKSKSDCGANASCGSSFEVGGFSSKSASSGSNKKRLGASVGSSKEFRQDKRAAKKEVKLNARLDRKAVRQQSKAARQMERDKKNRVYRHANSRFL